MKGLLLASPSPNPAGKANERTPLVGWSCPALTLRQKQGAADTVQVVTYFVHQTPSPPWNFGR